MIDGFKTWIELKKSNAWHNCLEFRKIIGPNVKLWAVVKSNAYGHGIYHFPNLIKKYVDGFCVDSLIEGERLRKNKIKKYILVLGPTIFNLYSKAKFLDIALTISNFEALKFVLNLKHKPKIHIKIDTGMNRQGFKMEEIPSLFKFLKKNKNHFKIDGVYTHFACSSGENFLNHTELQFKKFKEIIEIFKKNDFSNLIFHSSATGGTLLDKKYHLNACRIGIGLYGYFPSLELKLKFKNKIELKPVLSWKTIISEIKNIKKGEGVGYELSWRAKNNDRIAILPIGYWHGLSRILSNKGYVLIHNFKAKIIGRISMDMTIVNVSRIFNLKIGDTATLIGGSDKKNFISAEELANLSLTNHYEFLTRLNPLIYKIIV